MYAINGMSVCRLAGTSFIALGLLTVGGCSSLKNAMTRAQEPADLAGEQLGQAVYSHEGNYIIAGGSPDTSAKYQLSLKVRMAGRVFFGYSQTNLWDISRASLPFRDTTHRPSVFFYGPQQALGVNRSYRMSYGIEHNSNGRDNLDSRSLDKLFLQTALIFGDQSSRYWRISAKL